MLVAAMDIGTNSTRLLIAKCLEGQINPVFADLEITRIGEGIGSDKRIQPLPLIRTIKCLERYLEKCREYKVEKMRIIATSAVRDAKNKDEVAREVYKKTGLTLEILSGEKEAELSFLGAISDLEPQMIKKAMVVDIGGGSTEFIYPTDNRIQYKSVNLGTVRLLENITLRDDIPKILSDLIPVGVVKKPILVGVAGTVTTLVTIKLGLEEYDSKLVHGQKLLLEEIKSMGKELSRLSLQERKKIKGLHPRRADVIPYGILILEKIMEYLEVSEITVSDKDSLHGLIKETYFRWSF